MLHRLFVLGLTILAAAANPPGPPATIERSAVARPGARVAITMSTGAELTLLGTKGDAVTVTSRATGPGAADATLSVTGGGDLITVTSGFSGSATSLPRMSVVVLLPPNLTTTVHSSGGSILVEGVLGSIDGATMGGKIRVANTRGHLHLETRGGALEVRDSDVDGSVQTAGGPIVLLNVPGDLTAISGGGRVTMTNVYPSGRSNTGDPITIRLDAGPIKLREAPNGADVSTSAGDVEILSSAGPVKVRTTAGDVRLESIRASIDAGTAGGNVWATLASAPAGVRQDVRISAANGDVHIKIPGHWGMTIESDLSYSREHVGRFQIHSDWPLQVTRSSEWDSSDGTARRHERAIGSIGSKEHVVHVSVTNGEIFLEKGE